MFLDRIKWDYNITTPIHSPLGGSQSALCYLAKELASRGNEVVLANHISTPGIYEGVDCRSLQNGLEVKFLNSFDAIISLNIPTGRWLREGGVTAPLVLWEQHDADQATAAPLRDNAERDAWTAFAMVSNWQAERYITEFAIPRERVAVLRNAVSPRFEQISSVNASLGRDDHPPLLVYTSTPFRGLDVLLTAFPTIRAAIPGCRLRVYSSMGVYQIPAEQDGYRVLFELCRAIDGAEYIGSVSQAALVTELVNADVLSYPCTFAETSCISAMEAMASGCLVIARDLGALPETIGDHGVFYSLKPASSPVRHAAQFAEATIEAIGHTRSRPEEFKSRILNQIKFARDAYSWKSRAAEWENTLRKIQR
jgi:glycosyltransferase involved in cell wall biosynthesis